MHRDIFHGMHGDVGAALFQRDFELLDEQPLAADLGKRAIENLIAAGGHCQNLYLAARV
jgi:hypothetical protein